MRRCFIWLLSEANNDYQTYCDAKHAVSNVEGGPMFSGPINNVDKISYRAIVKNAVVKIAANTSGKKCKGCAVPFIFGASEQENRKNDNQSDCGNDD